MNTTAALLLATGLALAGCVSEDPALDTAQTCNGSATASGNDASATATCDGATATADGESATATSSGTTGSSSASATSSASTTTLVPFTAEGNTYNGIFACAAVTCQGSDLPTTGQGSSWFEPDIAGTLIAAELTLTWSATTPLTAELLLGIAYENDEGENDWLYAIGTSPLTLTETNLDIPTNKVNAIYVNPYKCQGTPAPLVACYGIEQAFTIEGTLTTATPPTVSATATSEP